MSKFPKITAYHYSSDKHEEHGRFTEKMDGANTVKMSNEGI